MMFENYNLARNTVIEDSLSLHIEQVQLFDKFKDKRRITDALAKAKVKMPEKSYDTFL